MSGFTTTDGSTGMDWGRVRTVARTDLKQLLQARDFWVPMTLLGGFFFVIIPLILLLSITQIGRNDIVAQVSETLQVLPPSAQEQIQGDSPEGRTGYALAVFLFAPVAVVVLMAWILWSARRRSMLSTLTPTLCGESSKRKVRTTDVGSNRPTWITLDKRECSIPPRFDIPSAWKGGCVIRGTVTIRSTLR